MSRNIGLLGGTFNPVHRGHVDLGLRVRETFNLDAVLYVLSARPPHKNSDGVVPAETRFEMLRAALSPFPGLQASDLEMRRRGNSYSIDTVTRLRRRYPGDRFYFISGSEGFLEIPTWKQWRRLLGCVVFIVVLREAVHREALASLLGPEDVPVRSFPLLFHHPPGVNLLAYESETLPFSSTRVRAWRRGGADARAMLDPRVTEIMEKNSLYGK